jgi:hypothetical protein
MSEIRVCVGDTANMWSQKIKRMIAPKDTLSSIIIIMITPQNAYIVLRHFNGGMIKL